MEMSELITRINELARKKRAEGLTVDEQQEQECLRKEYLKLIRAQVQSELDRIIVVDKESAKQN